MKPNALCHELFTAGLLTAAVYGCVLLSRADPDPEQVAQDLEARIRWVDQHCPQAADHAAFRYPRSTGPGWDESAEGPERRPADAVPQCVSPVVP